MKERDTTNVRVPNDAYAQLRAAVIDAQRRGSSIRLIDAVAYGLRCATKALRNGVQIAPELTSLRGSSKP